MSRRDPDVHSGRETEWHPPAPADRKGQPHHRKPSIASLRLFLNIARTQSFSETARCLNISQPALSRSIRILEEQMGQRLFERTTRNVSLTWAGNLLLPVAQHIVTDFDNALDRVSLAFVRRSGRVVVGTLPSIAAGDLSSMISSFRRSHPEVEIVLNEGLSRLLHEQLKVGAIDFAICTSFQENDDLDFRPVYHDPCGLVCRSDDPLAARSEIHWPDFERRPFLSMAEGTSVRALTDAAFRRTGIDVMPLFECSYVASLGKLVEQGLGISAVPLACMSQMLAPDIVWRPIEDPLASRPIGIARMRERPPYPTAEALMDHIAEGLAASAGVPSKWPERHL